MEDDTTTFHYNEYSWNTMANVLYIESPGGVGFSTCGDTLDCTFDDNTSAQDNFVAVMYFLETLFPEYQSNDLYLSGESYAGIYVPYLFDLMATYLEDNEGSTSVYLPNLKGFMVGNGVTNWQYDTTPAFVEMGFMHGLYDIDLYNSFVDNDCFSQYSRLSTTLTATCRKNILKFESLVNKINVYDVYGKCYSAGVTLEESVPQMYESATSAENERGDELRNVFTAKDYTPFLFERKEELGTKRLMELPPCTFGQPIIDYLNSDEVMEALHIKAGLPAWDLCTDNIEYVILDDGSQWIYEKWIQKGLDDPSK